MPQKLKQRVLNAVKEDWCMQTCQFEYLHHLKPRFSIWHSAAFTGALLLCFLSTCLGLLSILPLVSWNYYVLFDKKRRAFKDDYRLQRYEFIGTIWASFLMSGVVAGLIVSWSLGSIKNI